MQFEPAVSQARDDRIVGDHDDGPSLSMKFAQLAQNDFFIQRVEVAGRFICQDNRGIVYQRPGNAHALLFSAGKLRWQMVGAILQSNTLQRGESSSLVRHAVEVLRQHYVFNGG